MNMTNTIIGAGMLAMGFALAKTGYILGVFLLVISAIAAWHTLRLLVFAAAHAPDTEASYSSIARMTFPKAVPFVDIALALNCLGVNIGYLVAVGDFMPKSIAGCLELLGFEAYPASSWILSRELWMTVCTVGLTPFSLNKDLDSLTYLSIGALSSVAYMAITVIFYFFKTTTKPDWHTLPTMTFSMDIFQVIPIIVFAYTCHPNIFVIYNDMNNKSPGKMSFVINMATSISCFIYGLVGLLAFFTFGENTGDDLLNNYANDWFITIARFALSILLFLSFPLYLYPCRLSIDSLILTYKKLYGVPISTENGIGVVVENKILDVGISLSVLGLMLLLSLRMNQLNEVLSIVGALCSTLISFVFPGAFFIKLTEGLPGMLMQRVIAGVIIAAGIGIGVGCIVSMY